MLLCAWHSAVDTGGKFAAAVIIDIPVANLKPISKTRVVNENLWKGVTTGPVVNLPVLLTWWQICHRCRLYWWCTLT